MHECFPVIVAVECVKYFLIGNGDSVSDIAAGQCFAKYQNIRQYLVSHETISGTAKSGSHFIKNQQHIIFRTEFSGTFQKCKIIHPHAACTLQERFHDKAVQLIMITFKGFFQGGDFRRNVDNPFFFIKGKMIIFVVTYLHGFEGVTVIGVGECQHQRAFPTLIGIVLQCHFQGYFHGNAAGIGEETVIKVTGEKTLQFFGELLHRIVSQSAQHDMAEMVGLFLNGGGQFRVFITVDHAPPGGDGINEFLVFCIEVNPVCIYNFIGFPHGFHLFIRIPDHLYYLVIKRTERVDVHVEFHVTVLYFRQGR